MRRGTAFVFQVAGAEVAAVVAGKNYKGVFEPSGGFGMVDHAAQVLVDVGATGQVLGVVPTPISPPTRQITGPFKVLESFHPAFGPDRSETIVLVVWLEKRNKHEERPVVFKSVQPLNGNVP